MTCLTGSRKACGNVVRIRRAFIYSRVTGIAVGGSPHKDISYVAISAEHVDVGARQRERRIAVAERCALPICR